MKVMSRKNRFIRRRISRHCSLRGTGSGEEKRRKKRRKETRRGNGGIGRRKISSVRIFRSGSVEQTETAEEGRLPRLTLRDNVAANGANLHTRSTHTRDLIRFFTVARYLFVERKSGAAFLLSLNSVQDIRINGFVFPARREKNNSLERIADPSNHYNIQGE